MNRILKHLNVSEMPVIVNRYEKTGFQPDQIEISGNSVFGWARIRLSGPRLTKKGNLHASQRGWEDYLPLDACQPDGTPWISLFDDADIDNYLKAVQEDVDAMIAQARAFTETVRDARNAATNPSD